MEIAGPRLSTMLPKIGPAVAQLPARSQTERLLVAALAVSEPAGTLVMSVKEASAALAKPVPLSRAVQASETSVECHRPSGAAQEICGGAASWTVTVKLALLVLPLASEAEQDTLVVPSGNTDPDDGTQVTVTEPLTRSVAVGEFQVATAPEPLLAAIVMFAGMLPMTGAVVSFTVTLNEAEAVLP